MTQEFKPQPKDEQCKCGHPKSQHKDFSLIATEKYGLQWHPNHHGQCSIKNCKCNQFTWTGWIY